MMSLQYYLEKHENDFSYLRPFAVFILIYLLQIAVAKLGLDVHHDLFMFDAARNALEGNIPYRDFFYQYNLGSIFLHVIALKIWGVKIVSLKIITAISYSLIALLIYACSAILGWRWAGFFFALLWGMLSPFYMPALNGFHPWSTVYMMTAVMAGAFSFIMALNRGSVLWSVFAGISFGMAFWFKQVAGLQILFVLVWIIFWIWKSSSVSAITMRFWVRILFGFAFGGVALSVPFFLYLYNHSILHDWWRSAFVFNAFFAASGDSASGLTAFIRTLLPVTKGAGYLSVVWSIIPLYLVGLLLLRNTSSRSHREKPENQYLRSDKKFAGFSLFAALGVSGWIEYFPLAHAFHTQLFMAPVFVLLAFGLKALQTVLLINSNTIRKVKYLFIFVVVVLVYESGQHLQGVIKKVANPKVMLSNDTPVAGLYLKPEYIDSFLPFYDSSIAAYKASGELPFIPMSVDPLRGMFVSHGHKGFNMGVDWTWPNEIVEPGFNQRRAQFISERKAPIFTDTILDIEGYIPKAYLAMPSPITRSHFLYVPSADIPAKATEVAIVNQIVRVSCDVFPGFESIFNTLPNSNKCGHTVDVIRLGGVQKILSNEISQLHVSILSRDELPSKLTALQYEGYLSLLEDELSKSVRTLYIPKHGQYVLQRDVSQDQVLGLFKFVFSRGKLLAEQNSPPFFTTLQPVPSVQPFIVMKKGYNPIPQVAWAKFWFNDDVAVSDDDSQVYYIAIPAGVINLTHETVLYVQIVLNDNTTQSYYVQYIPK